MGHGFLDNIINDIAETVLGLFGNPGSLWFAFWRNINVFQFIQASGLGLGLGLDLPYQIQSLHKFVICFIPHLPIIFMLIFLKSFGGYSTSGCLHGVLADLVDNENCDSWIKILRNDHINFLRRLQL